jgi:O-methyltransferase domain
MLMTVLHDWSDEESVAILNNIRASAPRAAKVLILEGVVQPDARDDFLLDLDIEMLVMTTGRERTRNEWEAVIRGAGMRLTRVIPAGAWSSIVEAEIA